MTYGESVGVSRSSVGDVVWAANAATCARQSHSKKYPRSPRSWAFPGTRAEGEMASMLGRRICPAGDSGTRSKEIGRRRSNPVLLFVTVKPLFKVKASPLISIQTNNPFPAMSSTLHWKRPNSKKLAAIRFNGTHMTVRRTTMPLFSFSPGPSFFSAVRAGLVAIASPHPHPPTHTHIHTPPYPHAPTPALCTGSQGRSPARHRYSLALINLARSPCNTVARPARSHAARRLHRTASEGQGVRRV